jgi:hypothetical protein
VRYQVGPLIRPFKLTIDMKEVTIEKAVTVLAMSMGARPRDLRWDEDAVAIARQVKVKPHYWGLPVDSVIFRVLKAHGLRFSREGDPSRRDGHRIHLSVGKATPPDAEVASIKRCIAILEAPGQHPSAIRSGAVELLGRYGTGLAIPALKRTLQDESPDVRAAASDALKRIGAHGSSQGPTPNPADGPAAATPGEGEGRETE